MPVEAPIRNTVAVARTISPDAFLGKVRGGTTAEAMGAKEKVAQPLSTETALVGVGAGNLGVMMRLDARKQFSDALNRGMGFYDSQAFGAGTLNIACDSNSDGVDFTSGASEKGEFASVRANSQIDGVENVVDLRGANKFYRGIGEKIQRILPNYPNSGASDKPVSHITFDPDHQEDNKRFTLHTFNETTGQSEVAGYANKVVLGNGAKQELSPYHELRTDLDRKSLYTAEQVLAGDGENMAQLFDKLKGMDPDQRKITILGISHGALATAAQLLKFDDDRVAAGGERILGENAITLLGKSEPRVWAKDRKEAEELYGKDNLDEELFAPNGAYNRFGGVRAGAKELLLKARSKGPDRETRVKIEVDNDIQQIWTDSRLDDSPVVIQAFGPSVNLVPVYDTKGNIIMKFDKESGNLMVGEKGNLETTYGEDIGIFTTGIGYPRKKLSKRLLQFAAPKENPASVTSANIYAAEGADDVLEGLGFQNAA